MADKDWAVRVSDLENPDSEISEALTQHAEQAVTEAVGPQVEAAQSAASAAQASAASAATSATAAESAAETATTMAGQTVALQNAAVAQVITEDGLAKNALSATYLAGGIVDENGNSVSTLRLMARSLSTNPLEIDDLWIEEV